MFCAATNYASHIFGTRRYLGSVIELKCLFQRLACADDDLSLFCREGGALAFLPALLNF